MHQESRSLRHVLLPVVLAGIALAGCATPQPKPVSAAATTTAPTQPNEIRWYRVSAEQRAIYAEVYRSATQAARARAATLPAGSWAVILDVDETVLDNSEYQKRLALSGQRYSDETWNAWVKERSAPALPGAQAFLDTVRNELKGRVVLVTNRKQSQCADTQENLRGVGIGFDVALCDATGDGNKNPRFQSVISGTAGLPALNVILWVGDNIKDFPGLDQQHTGDAAEFGTRFFVLPNPMYGSWERLPDR
jgi:5'-nucleotidase (lipoprotein e(P4) family)